MARHPAQSAVSARQVDMQRLYYQYTSATTTAERLSAGEELRAELAKQLAVDTAYTKFLEILYPGDEAKQASMRQQKTEANEMECEMATHEAFREYGAVNFDANSGFALQFHQIVVNVCADVKGLNVDVPAAAKAACEVLV